MSLLSTEKTREKCFAMVKRECLFLYIFAFVSASHGSRLDRWENLMEYVVRVTGNFGKQTFIEK